MKIFKLNFEQLASQLLPTGLRQPKLTHLLQAAILPLKLLYEKQFLVNRQDNLYKLTHNGQVCRLRAMLNDTFDLNERRITIEEVEIQDWLMLYRDEEAKPVMLGTKIVWREDMIGSNSADFIVNVPFSLGNNPQEANEKLALMHSLVNFYKLASKRYIINTK